MSFEEIKEEYDKNYNEGLKETGIFWAFSNEQFEQYKTHKDAPDNEYISIGYGGYIHKSNKEKYDNFLKVVVPKLKADFVSKIDMVDLIEYELINHECYYTHDISDVIGIVNSYYNLPTGDMYRKVKRVFDFNLDKNKQNGMKRKSYREEAIQRTNDMIAIKSGYYFMLFKKDNVPFFDDLEKTDKVVNVDNKNYSLYQAPNWDLAQRVDSLMGNDNLGYDIDEYLVNKDINM